MLALGAETRHEQVIGDPSEPIQISSTPPARTYAEFLRSEELDWNDRLALMYEIEGLAQAVDQLTLIIRSELLVRLEKDPTVTRSRYFSNICHQRLSFLENYLSTRYPSYPELVAPVDRPLGTMLPIDALFAQLYFSILTALPPDSNLTTNFEGFIRDTIGKLSHLPSTINIDNIIELVRATQDLKKEVVDIVDKRLPSASAAELVKVLSSGTPVVIANELRRVLIEQEDVDWIHELFHDNAEIIMAILAIDYLTNLVFTEPRLQGGFYPDDLRIALSIINIITPLGLAFQTVETPLDDAKSLALVVLKPRLVEQLGLPQTPDTLLYHQQRATTNFTHGLLRLLQEFPIQAKTLTIRIKSALSAGAKVLEGRPLPTEATLRELLSEGTTHKTSYLAGQCTLEDYIGKLRTLMARKTTADTKSHAIADLSLDYHACTFVIPTPPVLSKALDNGTPLATIYNDHKWYYEETVIKPLVQTENFIPISASTEWLNRPDFPAYVVRGFLYTAKGTWTLTEMRFLPECAATKYAVQHHHDWRAVPLPGNRKVAMFNAIRSLRPSQRRIAEKALRPISLPVYLGAAVPSYAELHGGVNIHLNPQIGHGRWVQGGTFGDVALEGLRALFESPTLHLEHLEFLLSTIRRVAFIDFNRRIDNLPTIVFVPLHEPLFPHLTFSPGGGVALITSVDGVYKCLMRGNRTISIGGDPISINRMHRHHSVPDMNYVIQEYLRLARTHNHIQIYLQIIHTTPKLARGRRVPNHIKAATLLTLSKNLLAIGTESPELNDFVARSQHPDSSPSASLVRRASSAIDRLSMQGVSVPLLHTLGPLERRMIAGEVIRLLKGNGLSDNKYTNTELARLLLLASRSSTTIKEIAFYLLKDRPSLQLREILRQAQMIETMTPVPGGNGLLFPSVRDFAQMFLEA